MWLPCRECHMTHTVEGDEQAFSLLGARAPSHHLGPPAMGLQGSPDFSTFPKDAHCVCL